jgi:hypothetical protein
MLKQSQKRTKRAPFTEAAMSRQPARKGGLIGHDPHRPPTQAREPHHDVAGEVLVHLQEVPVIHHGPDDLLDVVGKVRLGRDDGIECGVGAVRGIVAGTDRRVLLVVPGRKPRAAG